MTLYTQQEANIYRTWLFIGIFLALIIGLGLGLAYVYDAPIILFIAIIIAIIQTFRSYWRSDQIILSLYKAKEIKEQDNQDLYRLVENLSITAGLPMPKIYLINDPSPNAFATGRDPSHSIICVTSGLLERLEKIELEGVIAHELSHIGNYDILLNSVMAVLAGAVSSIVTEFPRSEMAQEKNNRNEKNPLILIFALIFIILSPIFATLLRLAISRKREFLADATGALLTRYPEGLAQALEKIASYPIPLQRINEATAHLFISDPFKKSKINWFTKLWLTHPPIEERIKALREMAM